MADHSKPTVTSLYSNFVAELDARLDDLAVMLDPARTTTSNIPTGAIRWASASSKWQLWNGSAWVDLAATYAINALAASSAAKWTTARTLSLSGDVTGSASVDGSANATISATLSNTGVAAGTYRSVTVDAKGRVTGATNPTTLAGYGITDAVPSADVAQVPAASKIVKATADGPIDLGWLDTAVARELRMLAVGINPSLDLDFGRQNYRRQNGAKGLETLADPFADFITFTRSTTASYMGADGLLKTAAINEPRIEYDPISGECKGLLIEESRANLLNYSEAYGSPWSWTQASIVETLDIAPDGTLAASLIEDTATATHYMSRPHTTSAGPASFSVYLKPKGRSRVVLAATSDRRGVGFDLLTGQTFIQNYTTNQGEGTITSVGNGWYRCCLTWTATAVSNSMRITLQDGANFSYQGDGTSGIFIWGAQLEEGSFPTSYIKTEASAVTRGADSASVTGANFSSWYRQDEYSVLSRSAFLSTTTFDTVWSIDDGQTSNRVRVLGWANGPCRLSAASGGASQVEIVSQTTRPRSSAVGIKVDDFVAAFDGNGWLRDGVAAMPVIAPHTLHIGSSNTTAVLNGHISRLTYWPKRLTNTQLQELSK